MDAERAMDRRCPNALSSNLFPLLPFELPVALAAPSRSGTEANKRLCAPKRPLGELPRPQATHALLAVEVGIGQRE
jgi:hypothetical protein